jgi:hypothetical protein
MVLSSGRGNALLQFEQRDASAEFSAPHEGHFMVEGWLFGSHPEDYPAPSEERQVLSSDHATRESTTAYSTHILALREALKALLNLNSPGGHLS